MICYKALAVVVMVLSMLFKPHANVPKERDWLREYAFCKCFQYATDDSTYFVKKDISLSVYREFAAAYPESVFQQIDSMAKKAAKDIKPSIITDYDGQKAVIKGCMTFYESDELKSFISTLRQN